MPGENGSVAGRSLGLHDVGGSRRAGVLCLNAGWRGVGRRCEFEIRSLIRTRAEWLELNMLCDCVTRGCGDHSPLVVKPHGGCRGYF